jgi:SAM-dependent methyltransferase
MKNLFYQSIEKQFHEYVKRSRYDKKDLSKLNTLRKLWHNFMNELLNNSENYSELLSNAPDQQDQLGSLYQFFFEHKISRENGKSKIIVKDPKQREPGKVYTPRKIISFIIDLIKHSIDEDISDKKKKSENNENNINKKNLKIADIACGTGRFLTHWWLKELRNASKHKKIPDTQYFGYDIDPTAIKIANQTPIKGVVWKNIDSLLDSNLDQTNLFDVIIGNPPYIESRTISDDNWNKIKKKYESAYKKFDLSVVFLEKIVNLLKPGGLAGIIITNKWLVSDYGEIIRKILLTRTHIECIIDVSHLLLFKGSSTYPIIIIFQKLEQDNFDISNLQTKLVQINDINQIDSFFLRNQTYSINQVLQSFFLKSPKNIISSNLDPSSKQILEHIWDLERKNEALFLGDNECPYELRKGIHTGNVKGKLFTTNPPHNDPNYKHAVTSRYRVDRFKISWQGFWVHYNKKIIDQTKAEYGSLREEWIFEAQPKIFIKLFGTRIQAAIDHLRYYANNSLILLIRKQKKEDLKYIPENWYVSREEEFYYILGVLNSQLISSYYNTLFKSTHVRGNFLQFYVKDLNNIPLMIPNQGNISKMKEIAAVAQNLTEFYRSMKLKSSEIEKLEKKLDNIVKKLYRIV